MMCRGLISILCVGLMGMVLAGCGGDGAGGANVKLAEAEGVVTFKGAPFAGANVTFIPENGPIAMGTTDLQGKFKLSSGALSGVAVGKAKVTVSAVEAKNAVGTGAPANQSMTKPANEEEMKKRMAAMDPTSQMAAVRDAGGAAEAKSLINVKFSDPATSGLTATIESDSSKNKFTFEVTE